MDRRTRINKIHAAVSETFSVAHPTIEIDRTIEVESRATGRDNDTADEADNARGRFNSTRNNIKGRDR